MKSIATHAITLASFAILSSCGSSHRLVSVPVGTSSFHSSGKTGHSTGTLATAKIELGIIDQVNEIRGGTALSRDSNLDLLARMHNRYMIQHQEELRMNGADTSYAGLHGRRAASYRLFCFDHTSENVATLKSGTSSTRTVDSLVSLWGSQENNKEPMFDPTWNRTGISVMEGKDGYLFVTQIYGKKCLAPNTLERRNFGL